MFIWIIILILSVFCDQLTKWLAVISLQGGEPVYLIPDVLRFVYVENRGAAFGMLSEHRWVFLVLSCAAIVGLSVYVVKCRPKSRLLMTGLTLIVGGGIGNMIDRMALGYVVDFIDFCAFPDVWMWVFNVADSCVCVGVGLTVLYIITDTVREYRAEKENKSRRSETDENGSGAEQTDKNGSGAEHEQGSEDKN